MGDAQGLQHGVESDRLDGLAQRQVDRHQHHAQLAIGQHHPHRRWRAAGGAARGQRLQHLGVPGVRHTRCGEGFFVDRRGDDRRAGAALNQAHGMLDAGRGSGTVACVDGALRQ